MYQRTAAPSACERFSRRDRCTVLHAQPLPAPLRGALSVLLNIPALGALWGKGKQVLLPE